jgi:putative ATP-dependent endonuclease of OLD family
MTESVSQIALRLAFNQSDYNMRIHALRIEGFRGVRTARLVFSEHVALVGPNGAGKSTVIDALSLLFGRTQMVRDLTEHDFFGSCPDHATRFRIIATLGGFESNEPKDYHDWFRDGRGIPKWWNSSASTVEARPTQEANLLCAEIGVSGRFDLDELKVELLRYFHDDDEIVDPFIEDSVSVFPSRLLSDIGFYVLPIRRTWESNVSFASELFRRAVTTLGGIPAQALLEERDRLRQPSNPLEKDALLKPLIDGMNSQFRQLLADAPQLQLRLTSTDSESVLRGLIPHYGLSANHSLPAGRHGTGLLSLQTFVLLLEIGRERKRRGLPFILALEEPELHIPPGLQRRLVAQAVSISEQTICASHAPRITAFYPATSTIIIDRKVGELKSVAMLDKRLPATASAVQRKMYLDDRSRIVESLMHRTVLVPEGRGDHEWLRLLSDLVETEELISAPTISDEEIPFGSVIGIVPTHSSAVVETFRELQRLHGQVIPMVDGDSEGMQKLSDLLELEEPPKIVLRWQDDWEIEDVIIWILKGDEEHVVPLLNQRLGWELTSLADLLSRFKTKVGSGRAKTDYLAYEDIASVIRDNSVCKARARAVLKLITGATLLTHSSDTQPEIDSARSTARTRVVVLRP